MLSFFSLTIKIFLGIKSALYILFAWWGFQVCSSFFLKFSIQQKDIKIVCHSLICSAQLYFTVG